MNIDILMISETKLDSSFPSQQLTLKDLRHLLNLIEIQEIGVLCFLYKSIFLQKYLVDCPFQVLKSFLLN